MPSGTVAFLFTDIEGSTSRWDRNRLGMQAAVRRHDALVRDAIERHAGHVFKTVGDAFCAAFPAAEAAVGAALDAQRALAGEKFAEVDGLFVRMALHAGAADERDGDYFGPPLNRIARLLTVANGGQILASAIFAQLAAETLPAGARFDDLGRVRLKDLSLPENVFQLSAAGLRTAFPALRSLDVTPNNLPERVVSFVGRGREIAELRAELAKARVLTIVGTGGLGKTQCALQVAAESLGAFPDGIWLFELAAFRAETAASHLLSVLGLLESPARSALDSLADFLKSRSALLVVDNCEHVLAAIAPVIEGIVARCPSVRVLATSREPLRVRGESLYHLPPLSGEESVALFAERAAAADGRFSLTPENAPAVAEICRRLDGLALAIELAAARVRLLPLPQLARRLDDRLRLLSGGRRTDQPRQQTVYALIDWSYQLLSLEERRWFRGLAIFQSSFSIESARAAAGLPGQDDLDALDAISSLADKSLVVADAPSERYRLLESLQAFGRRMLSEGGELGAAAARHAEWVLAFHRGMSATEGSEPHEPWRARLEVEFEETRAALQWAIDEGGDPHLAATLLAESSSAWVYFAPYDGLRRLAAVRAATPALPAVLAARLAVVEARLSLRTRKYSEALAAAESALATLAELDDAPLKREARRQYATALVALGRSEDAERETRAVIDEFRASGQTRMVNACLHVLAVARDDADDLESSRRLFEEALTNAIAAGHAQDVADIADNYSVALNRAGLTEQALARNAQAVAVRRRIFDRNTLPLSLNNRAEFCLLLERYAEAREAALEAFATASDVGSGHQQSVAQYQSALAELRLGDAAGALRSFASAMAAAEPETLRSYAGEYAALRAELEAAAGPEAVAEAIALDSGRRA